MLKSSPFIFEDAVPKEKFFDRKDELDFFIRSVSVKRKILLSIVAPLKYGKSSLMMRYYEILQQFDDVVPIYINLKRKSRPIRFLVEELRNYGIDVYSEYQKCLNIDDLEPFFNSINRIMVQEGKWLFLLIDEFHLLPARVRAEGFYKNFSDSDIFGFFRSFAEGARISYVVCGSVIEPLMSALDVWGGRFQIIYLGPFSEDDAINMIKKLFMEGEMPIDDDNAKIIAEAAGYHPFYIQYMGHQIYIAGEISRRTIRQAKQKLFEFLSPIFFEYTEKILNLGKEHLESIKKLIRNEPLKIEDRVNLGRLMKMGILKPKNAKFEFIDPLFKRYIQQIVENLEPTEVTVVGHWAERIVGNYLLKRGYMPYYSHDSKGAFDIYVKIKNLDVGIQVKYTSKGEIYLPEKEAKTILAEAKKLGWKPILAIVSKQIKFISNIKPGKYSIKNGYKHIEKALLAD